jgi:hypothetical protein
MKTPRQTVKAGLQLLCLITFMLVASARAAEFPELGVVPRNGGFRMEGYWPELQVKNAHYTESLGKKGFLIPDSNNCSE